MLLPISRVCFDGNIIPQYSAFQGWYKTGADLYNKHMQVLALVSWWYGLGWLDQASLVRQRFARATDRYSLSLLLRTLFSPFKQLDAYGGGSGPLDARLRAWLDRLISRLIGAMIRSFMIIVGVIVLVFELIVAVVRLAIWPVIPVLPILGLVLALTGWFPWR